MIYTKMSDLIADVKAGRKNNGYALAQGPTSERAYFVKGFGSEKSAAQFVTIRHSHIPGLDPIPEERIIVQHVHPIDTAALEWAAAVCLEVYRQFRSEMVLLLRWCDGHYAVDTPLAAVSPTEVSYYTERPFSGTIHYHPGRIGAKPSSTDNGDELWTPGINVILSNAMNGSALSEDIAVNVCLTGNGNRIELEDQFRILNRKKINACCTPEQMAFALERVIPLDELLNKKNGYYLANDCGVAVFWTKTKEEAEAFKGKLEVVPVRALKIQGISPEDARKNADKVVKAMIDKNGGKVYLRYIKEAIERELE